MVGGWVVGTAGGTAGGSVERCQDTSDPGHFGPKTFRHWCQSVRKTLRHQCRTVRTYGTSAEVSIFGTKEDTAGFAAPGNTGTNLGKEGAVPV